MTLDEYARAAKDTNLVARATRLAAREVEALAVAGVKQNFADGVSPDGTPWRPLAHPRPGQGGTGRPLRDKGLLAASVSALVTADGLALRASGPGARLHQDGGTVAGRGRLLALPITREAARYASPRRFPRPLFFLQSGQGSKLLAERTGTGRQAKLVVHYALKASVTVPARPYLGVGAAALALIAGAVGRRLAGLALGRKGA